eukprot:CAMPEP_0196666032 /NCGR_PEP_ID=MMETSP1086-20130531/63585_1 /TAXON_ID=77921 /ORGANISM="Cyanoptyche  gloeocystis , Strain SAG4.97" /LENGTH=65 /DNA_ID=CAMNT_0042003079 /DNA_START=43 /DNA_END=236 /DNA_ORIENTATION=-
MSPTVPSHFATTCAQRCRRVLRCVLTPSLVWAVYNSTETCALSHGAMGWEVAPYKHHMGAQADAT